MSVRVYLFLGRYISKQSGCLFEPKQMLSKNKNVNNNSKYEEETKHTQWLNASELIEVSCSLCAHKEQEENF